MTHGSEVISPPVHPTGQSWGTPEEHICLSVTRTARRAVPWVCPVTRPRTAIPNTTDVPASRRAVALAWGRTAPTRTHRPEGRMASPPNSSRPGTLECDLRQGSMDKEWPRADGVGCRGGGVRTGRGPRVGPTHDPTSPLCESWTDGGQASRAEQGAEGRAEPLISKSQLGGPGGPAEDRFGLLTFSRLPGWR